MVYALSYDLVQPGRDYTKLFEAIKAIGSWCHPLESFWLVDTLATAKQVADAVIGHMDSNDKVFVIRTHRAAAWQGINPACADWINDAARRW